ncbi:hypothetical protein BV372_04485 [Nostoc sp. T09]|uniref:hypothetical protein n=1 Tax=Nostoc sp. T09 TaxID=1932621 RepID=UPI000A395489|nr:hypothetical protein [Nostoc sp. T09]OUL36901.1 hypothetical protein BV372_04485 [Nostoc sp. T09]
MNIKHFPFHLGLSFTFALALITCQTSQPASAQAFNQQTDVTGNIITTGDITGGTFQNPPTNTGGTVTIGDIQGGTLPYSVTGGRDIKEVVFKSPSIQASVNNTALEIVSKLDTNSLTSLTGQPIASETQKNLRSVLTGSECVPSTDEDRKKITDAGNRDNTNACTGQITAALSSVQGNPGLDQVQQLANKLQGLLKTNQSKQVDPIRLVNVVNAYNNLIDNSSAEFLNNPPPELQAIQSVLLQLVNSVVANNQ